MGDVANSSCSGQSPYITERLLIVIFDHSLHLGAGEEFFSLKKGSPAKLFGCLAVQMQCLMQLALPFWPTLEVVLDFSVMDQQYGPFPAMVRLVKIVHQSHTLVAVSWPPKSVHFALSSRGGWSSICSNEYWSGIKWLNEGGFRNAALVQ